MRNQGDSIPFYITQSVSVKVYYWDNTIRLFYLVANFHSAHKQFDEGFVGKVAGAGLHIYLVVVLAVVEKMGLVGAFAVLHNAAESAHDKAESKKRPSDVLKLNFSDQ